MSKIPRLHRYEHLSFTGISSVKFCTMLKSLMQEFPSQVILYVSL